MLLFSVANQPARAALPTPNQPVLVVQSSASADPYQNFVPELLATEGINGFQTAQLSELTAAFLSSYDAVILPHLSLTAAQATLFSNYVNAGGTLIGFRPDLQLASVFGVASLGSTLSEAWLKIDTGTPYGAGLDATVMRFHGAADKYSLNGATALALLYNGPASPTISPAASIYTWGTGKAILFSFDLAQSIVLMRQGNPAWAGYPNSHDGFNTLRASQMFMDKNTGQYWNDLGDGALNDIPQADIQLRLFSNALLLATAAKRPLPRLWYFPSQNRALLLMTGDQHGDAASNSISETNTVASYGGKFSEFLWYPFGSISNNQVNSWISAGHAMGVHFDDTAETDSSGVGGSAASWNGMQNVLTSAINAFKQAYPSAPFPRTTRDHFLIWVSRNSSGAPDPVAQAKLFQNAGIELDVSYTAFPNRWGYMTGSGLPMKFLDIPSGAVIPVYEQATQYEDDVQLSGFAYSTQWNFSTAQSHYQQSLSDSLNKYNTVVTMLFHPDTWSTYSSYAQAVLSYAQAHSIPMLTTESWLQFWKSRAATAVSMPSFSLNQLTFTVSNAPAGLTLLLPNASGANQVTTITVDNVSQSFTPATYQGISYAGIVLDAGTHNISASYGPPPATYSISGTISPAASGAGATVTLSGAASATTTADGSGNYSFTGLANGSYTVTPAKPGFTFNPANAPVTVNNASLTGVNFTASAAPAGQTLFTTQTPAITNASDGSGVNYELGTAFASSAPGQITAIRFWKASNESGTHTGKIWSSSGTLLASVAFSAETASGWQQQSLPAPLSIAANTTYIVSVNTGNTFYVATNGGLATPVVNGNLSSIAGNNGLFGAPGAFPTNSWQNSNYFRDIVFVPGATYSISGTISPAASGAGTTVTLSGAASATTTADGSGNYSFTGLANGSYTVTPAKPGFSFTPANRAVSINSTSVTGVSFTASAISGITIDAAAYGDRGSAAASVTSAAFSTTAGNELILAFIGADMPSSSGTNNSVTSVSGGGLAWTLVSRTNTQRGTSEIWRAFAASPLSNVTVTANLATSAVSSLTVMSFKGVNTSGTNGSGAIGAIGSGNSLSGAPTASLVTIGNNSLVVGVGEDWNASPTVTPGSNQTMVHSLAVPGLATFWVQRQNAVTPVAGTAVTINDSPPTTARYNLTICEILAQ